MKTARTSTAPSVYEHATQPQWGRGVVATLLVDRATYVFENAGERTFMNGYKSIVEVELDAEEREALAKKLLRGHAAAGAAAKKKATKKRAPKAAKAPKATKASKAAEPAEVEPAATADDE